MMVGWLVGCLLLVWSGWLAVVGCRVVREANVLSDGGGWCPKLMQMATGGGGVDVLFDCGGWSCMLIFFAQLNLVKTDMQQS